MGQALHDEHWVVWQTDVLALLRADLGDVLETIEPDEVDWPEWRSFYLDGRSPRAAINRALERDL